MIRPIRQSDVQAVADIYNYYIEHTQVSYEEKILDHAEMAVRVDRVVGAGFPWLVAEDAGKVAGYAYGYHWNTRAAYRHTAEITVYLLPGATGKGLGTALYTRLFAELGEAGIRNVIGGIGLPNAASIALHEKMGLKKVAHFEKVGYKFDQWLDVGYWQGHLGPVGPED